VTEGNSMRGVCRIEGKWLTKTDVADMVVELRMLRKRREHAAVFEEIARIAKDKDDEVSPQQHAMWIVLDAEEVQKALSNRDLTAFRSELVNLAAIIVTAIKCLDRNADATP